MSTKGIKNHDLSKAMDAHNRRIVAEITGFSMRYIHCILNVDDKRYNQQVIDVCEALLEGNKLLMEHLNQLVLNKSAA